METIARARTKPRQYRVQQPLTPREQQLLEMKKRGISDKEIAVVMGVKVRTLETTYRVATNKLGHTPRSMAHSIPRAQQRRKIAIKQWFAEKLIPELIKRNGKTVKPAEVAAELHKQFPQSNADGLYKRYTLPLFQALLRAGIIRNEGGKTRPHYVVQWPPRPLKKYDYRARI